MSRCLTRPFTRALQGALTTLILIAMYSTVRGAAAEPAVPGCTVLTITPQMFSAPAIGVPSTAAVQVSVYANGGCGWTVQVPPAYSWLHVVPQQGTGSGGFSFSVDPFPVGQRSGYIHVLAGSIHRILTVNQGTAPPGTCLVTTTPTNGSSIALASTGGGSIQVTTGTTCAWTVEVTGPDSSWLQPSPASGVGPNTILLNAQANCGAQRTAGVRVHTANGLSTLTVNQAASAIAAPAVGLTVTVDSTLHSNQQTPVTTIPASCPWSAAITTVPTPNWLTLVNASSSGGNFVGWSVTANDGPSAISRSATITVTSGAATRSFIVQQTAPPCSVTTPANGLVVEQSSSVGSGSTPVTTNLTYCTWSAEFVAPAPGWLTLTQTTGTGSGSIGWRAHENTGAARSASIRVSCGATSSTFTVQQDAPPCTVIAPADGLIVPQSSAGGTGSTPVTMSQANCVWTAAFEAPIPTWIALTTSSGTGAGAVGWSVHANTGVARSAVIKMTSASGISTFTVQQAAPPPPPECTITAPANNLLVAQPSIAGPGATPVTITTNTCEWTATFVGPAPEWLSFTTSAGTGNGSVGWIVLENTGAVRSVDINVTSTAGLTTFRVQQASPSPPVCALTQPVNGSVVDQSSSVGPGSTAVAVTDPTCAWSAAFVGTPPPDWLVLTTNAGTGDGSVGWRAHQNTGPLRSTSIIVTSGSSTSTFTVRQVAPVCSISAPVDGLVVDQSSLPGIGVTPVTVSEVNCAWGAEIVGAAPGWILLTTSSGTGDGEVKWSVLENTGSLRSAAIRVTSASNTTTFTVDQHGSGACSFATNPETGTTLYLDSGAPTGAIAVVVADSCAWSATSSDSTWLHVTAGSSGTGFGSVLWKVDGNSGDNCVGRVATITVTNAHSIIESTITFVQACGVTASPTSVAFVATTPASQSVTVSAIACPDWRAIVPTPVSWFTLHNASGATGPNVTWHADPNTDSIRSVDVKVIYSGGSSTFTVVQPGSGTPASCAITSPIPGTEVDAATGGLTVTLQGPCAIQWAAGVVSESSWCTLVANTGLSGAQVTWTASPNSGSVRYAEIAVNILGSQSFFIIKQNGPAPDPEATPCTATTPVNYQVVAALQTGGPGSALVTLANSNCQWTAQASASWITLFDASGTGNGSFNVQATTNAGPARSGVISIGYHPQSDEPIAVATSVPVTQAAASGLLPCTNETNPAPGATVNAIADASAFDIAIVSLPPPAGGQCTWTASANKPWVTLSADSGEGVGNVQCTVSPNLGGARTATIAISQGSDAGPFSSITVSQAAWTSPEGCTGSGTPQFSPPTTTIITLDPSGERGSIGVLAGEVCVWSATADSPWLQCTCPTGVTGAGSIAWNAQANTTGETREATITLIGGQTHLSLSQASSAVDCSVQLASVNWPGPSQDNLMFSFGVSTKLQQRLTEQFGADHWDENVFVNLFSDLGASGASPRPASGWPVMSLSGHPGCQFVTASDRAGNLIPANRFATIGSNFLSASFPLSTLRYSDGGHYLVTNATATADWFPGVTTWEGLFQWCTGSPGSPQQKCINSGQLLLSLYRPLESQGGAVASCLTTDQSPNCPSPMCGSVAGMAGGLPEQSFATWCADSHQQNPNCVDVAETWWNCDQLTPQTSVEFTWPADGLANQLSGDVTYINGVGLPVAWVNKNCGGTSLGQPAQDSVLGYSFAPSDNPPQPHHALGTGFAQGWWSEDSFAAAPVKAFNADNWSKLTQYLTSAGTLTGTKLATLTSFPSYPPGTPPVCEVAGASGATWDYAGYGQPPHNGFCTAASQTNPCMPLEFASATTWNFTAHWVQVGDANTQPWWEPLQSLEVIGQALIPGSDPAEYFYASFIAAEETGFVVCTGTVKTSSSDFPPIGSTFYVVMPYQQNFADASQIYTPNPKYVVLWDSPNNSSVTTCGSFRGRITDTAFEASATSYWRRYWANGSDASAMASISGDLSNSIVWGLFANTTAVNATPRTINSQDWGSVYSYCPVGSSGHFVDLSMGAYYCILANLNGTNGEIPRWIGSGLGGTIFSEFVDYWVAGSFVTGAVQPVAVGYYTSYQDRIKSGPLGQSSQNPTLNSGADFGYIELTVMDPWGETPPPPPLPMGDADGDGCTDVEDLYYMLSVWGPVNSGHSADFNRDGMVDSRDFPSFLGGFGSGCDP